MSEGLNRAIYHKESPSLLHVRRRERSYFFNVQQQNNRFSTASASTNLESNPVVICRGPFVIFGTLSEYRAQAIVKNLLFLGSMKFLQTIICIHHLISILDVMLVSFPLDMVVSLETDGIISLILRDISLSLI